MSASTLRAPGAKYGPCERPCSHMDCEASRKMAAAVCPLCAKPIGWDTRFYDDRSNHGLGLVHALCLEEQVEREQAKGG